MDRTPLADWLQEPLLRAEEEPQLAMAIELGLIATRRLQTAPGTDPDVIADLRLIAAEGTVAFERFIRANMRLAAFWARRRWTAGGAGTLTVDDLTAEGALGLIRALQKWDYARGLKFSTYAVAWVKQFQSRAVLRDLGVGLTVAEQVECTAFISARSALAEDLQREPTPAELATAMSTTRRRVFELQNMLRHTLSFEAPATGSYDNRRTLGDTIAAPEPDAGDESDLAERAGDLSVLIARLPQRERDVVTEMFGFLDGEPKTVEEVASRRRVPVPIVAAAARAGMAHLQEYLGLTDAADLSGPVAA